MKRLRHSALALFITHEGPGKKDKRIKVEKKKKNIGEKICWFEIRKVTLEKIIYIQRKMIFFFMFSHVRAIKKTLEKNIYKRKISFLMFSHVSLIMKI